MTAPEPMSGRPTATNRLHRVGCAVEERLLDDACAHEAAASGRHLLSDIAKFCVALAAFHVLIDEPSHEMGHWVTAMALGFQWDFLHHAFVAGSGTIVSPTAVALIDMAGGLFSGAILSVLALIVPPAYRNGIVPLAAAEFAYAPFDPSVLGDAIGLAVFFIASGAIAFVYVHHYLAARDVPAVVEDSVWEATRHVRFLECLERFGASLDSPVRGPSVVG